MLTSSDSDDDSQDNILRRLESKKRQIRAQIKPSNCNYASALNSSVDDDDVILVSETFNCMPKPCSSKSLNDSTPDVIIVSDTPGVNKQSDSSNIRANRRNYDTSNLFLNDPDFACSRTSGKRKNPIDPDFELFTTSKRGRDGKTTKGPVTRPSRARGRGRSRRRPNSNSPPSPLARQLVNILEPIKKSTWGRGRGMINFDKPVIPGECPILPEFSAPEFAHLRRFVRDTRLEPLGPYVPRIPPSTVTQPQNRDAGCPRRTTRRAIPSNSNNYPTYSVGNTDEYPDASDKQELFASVPKKVQNVKENNEIDINHRFANEDICVKVLWRSFEVVSFNLRRLQKMSLIFDCFYKRKGVNKSNLLLTYNGKTLTPDDTPATIDYNIVKFIDGGIISSELAIPYKGPVKFAIHGFVLKFQCQDRKKPYEVVVSKDDQLYIAMVKCSEMLDTPMGNLKFTFDGERVYENTTPCSLDMDSGDCIDVQIIDKK